MRGMWKYTITQKNADSGRVKTSSIHDFKTSNIEFLFFFNGKTFKTLKICIWCDVTLFIWYKDYTKSLSIIII